jgi:anti-sigma B factor antagonist
VKLQTEQHGGVAILKPEEPLTNTEADEFKAILLEAVRNNLGRVVLDASAVAFVDSKGLESLVDVTQELNQSGKVLKICCVNETIKQVIELTGLWSQFEYFEDANSAIRSFL